MSYGHALKTAGHQDARHRRLSPQPAAGAGFGRSLVEPGQPEDLPFLRRRPVRDAAATGPAAGSPPKTASTWSSRSARRWRTRANTRPRSAHYQHGNELRRATLSYSAEDTSARVARIKRGYTREFFERRAGFGADAPDPIFIVGLPRAGSTLLEQILSSHSAVEGTMELPEITSITRDLRGQAERRPGHALPRRAGRAWTPTQLRALGERYLRAHAHPAQDRRAVLHRQDAEQLPAHRPDPADPAERQDHRRAPASAGLLLLRLQAAFRPRPELHLRPGRHRPLLRATTSS